VKNQIFIECSWQFETTFRELRNYIKKIYLKILMKISSNNQPLNQKVLISDYFSDAGQTHGVEKFDNSL